MTSNTDLTNEEMRGKVSNMAYKDPLDERARASRRNHYRENREQYYERNRIKYQKMKDYVNQLKSEPCMDCGVAYPPHVMDFDHRDPAEKTDVINTLMKRGSWKKLNEEIDKCDVVCANCHRERTWGSRT